MGGLSSVMSFDACAVACERGLRALSGPDPSAPSEQPPTRARRHRNMNAKRSGLVALSHIIPALALSSPHSCIHPLTHLHTHAHDVRRERKVRPQRWRRGRRGLEVDVVELGPHDLSLLLPLTRLGPARVGSKLEGQPFLEAGRPRSHLLREQHASTRPAPGRGERTR